MTRVLQLIHSDENGGVEMLARLIGNDLQSAGVSVQTLFLYPSFSASMLAKVQGLGKACLLIVQNRPDALLAYQPTASVIAGLAGRAFGCPKRIVHQTSKPSTTHRVSRWLDKWLGSRRFYTVNIANSHATLAEFDAYPAAYRANLTLIEHGIEPPEPRSTRPSTLARYGIVADGPVLLHAGRLNEQKAQHLILAALPQLPSAQLVLAGGGPLEANYRQLAMTLGIEDRVHFLGFLDRAEVGDLMGAADVFVFPSVWETFGLAAVEAAMLGVPVVCADLPALREVLAVDGKTIAQFVDCADTAKLAEAIRSAITPDSAAKARVFSPGLRAKHSQAAMLQAYRDMILPAPQRTGQPGKTRVPSA